MPEILREKFSLGQGKAGVSAILFVQIASLVGALVGGTLADRWMRHTPRGRIYASAIGMVLFLPALFSVGNAGTLSIAIIGLIIFGLGWGFFDCNNMPILCQIARPEWRATGYGIMNLVSISCGGFGDWAFGALRDRDVPLNLIFGVFAGVALLSVFIVLMIRPRSRERCARSGRPRERGDRGRPITAHRSPPLGCLGRSERRARSRCAASTLGVRLRLPAPSHRMQS